MTPDVTLRLRAELDEANRLAEFWQTESMSLAEDLQVAKAEARLAHMRLDARTADLRACREGHAKTMAALASNAGD